MLTRSEQLADCTVTAFAGSVVANHVTVIGSGTGYGVCSWSNDAFDTAVSLTNSIVYGNQYDLSRSGEPGNTANLTVQFSRFLTTYKDQTPPGGSFVNGAGSLSTVPSFVESAAGDYRLKAPSPLIDAGDPADALSLDAEKLPRKVDGDTVLGARSDLGAHEYQRRVPSALATVPASAVAGEPVEVDAAAGTYLVELTVTDSSGLSATATQTVSAATPPAAPGGGGPGGGGAGGSGPGGDATAPTLSLLTVKPARVRLGKALPTVFAQPKRGTIRLRLSERAVVRISFKRLTGKRSAAGSFSLTVPAGAHSIRFAGRLSRKRTLAPGRCRVAAIATDAVGNRGAARTAKIRLLPRRGAG